MDYRNLIEKFFQGTTSHEEEEALRRYLMEDNPKADILEEKEMLLLMLQPIEYECSEAMEEISAMVDRLAAQEVEQKSAVIPHKLAPRKVLIHYVYSAMAIAGIVALLLIFFPYNSNNTQQSTAPIVAVVVEEPSANDTAIKQQIAAQDSATTEEPKNNTDVKNASPMIVVPLVTEPEKALVANETKEKSKRLDTRNIYIGAVNTDVQEIPGYNFKVNNMRSSYQADNDKRPTAMTGTKYSNKYIVKRQSDIYLRGWNDYDGILSEPSIKKDSFLQLSDILAGIKIDHFANPADATRLVEMRDSISAYSPEVEMMLQMQYDRKNIKNEPVLTMDDVMFASEDYPWNPASPLHIYSIHNEKNETVITFLYSICFRSQLIPFGKEIYAQDKDSGDKYNVLGYAGGQSMEQTIVVNGCIGRNILISLRFPKFKKNRGRINIFIPWEQGIIKLAE